MFLKTDVDVVKSWELFLHKERITDQGPDCNSHRLIAKFLHFADHNW